GRLAATRSLRSGARGWPRAPLRRLRVAAKQTPLQIAPELTVAGHRVHETHVLFLEDQRGLAGGSVPLFLNPHIENAFLLARLQALRTVQENDGVRVLLDGAGFAQVAQSRLV